MKYGSQIKPAIIHFVTKFKNLRELCRKNFICQDSVLNNIICVQQKPANFLNHKLEVISPEGKDLKLENDKY